MEGEEGGESGGGNGVFDAGGEGVEVEEAGGRGRCIEEALEAAAETGSAAEVGGSVSGMDDEDGGGIGEFVEGERRSKDGGLHSRSVLPVEDAEPGVGGGGRVGADAEILADMGGLAHAGEGERDARGGAGELEGEFGVRLRFVPPGAEVTGDAVDKAGLVKGGAGDDGDAGVGCDFEDIDGFVIEQDVGEGEGLGHTEVEGELEEAEVVVVAAGLAGEFEDSGEGEAIGLAGFEAEGGPGGGAVKADLVGGAELFETGESVEESLFEFVERDVGKLGFGVVEVENVDGVEVEVGA
jgi:hypothetical protein